MSFPSRGQMEKIIKSSVYRISPFHRNWLIYTNDQTWVAKKIRSRTHHHWWLHVDQELRRRGFRYMPKIKSDQNWMLTPLIKGEMCQYTHLEDTKKVMKVLALFHVRGRRLQMPPANKAAFLLTHRLHERLVQFYQILNEAPHIGGEEGDLLRTYGMEFYRYGLKAWERLAAFPLEKWNLKEYYSHCLAHRDLASHNWIIDQEGKAWLIDFDTANYDYQLGDVWQISTRILSSNHWSPQVYEQIISTYEQIKPLTSWEKKALSILFLFPNEVYRELMGLIKRKPGYTLKNTLPYVKRLIQERDQWHSFTKQIHTW